VRPSTAQNKLEIQFSFKFLKRAKDKISFLTSPKLKFLVSDKTKEKTTIQQQGKKKIEIDGVEVLK
jgi:hypothetical protein